MTANDRDWERWQREFRAGSGSQPDERNLVGRLARARRSLAFTRVVESIVGAAALLLIVFALRHAASPYEAMLGFSVGIVIALVWAQRIIIRRLEYTFDDANSVDYLAGMQRLARRQIQLAQFIWLALALELVFLIPWWVIGSRVHSRRITNIGSLLTMWIPIVGFVALLIWALRLGLRARRQMRDLARVGENYREVDKDAGAV